MQIETKSRSELKLYFKKNDIPTELHFAELIDGMLNQKNDGIAKLPQQPLSIQAADETEQKETLRFYGRFDEDKPQWVFSLNPQGSPGFSISDGKGNSRLCINRENGNVGIGTTAPAGKLDVRGAIFAGNSDLYFTNIKHTHTGTGNIPGFAAIENCERFNALMILGRTVSKSPLKRVVKLWDHLEVNGSMTVTCPGTGSFTTETMGGINHIGTTYVMRPHASLHGAIGHPKFLIRNIYVHDIYQNYVYKNSDARIKENFRTLSSPVEKLMQLKGHVYDMKQPASGFPERNSKNRLGFVAQEVQRIFPQLVAHDDKVDEYYVEYDGIIPVIVEAFKQFRSEVLDQQAAGARKLKRQQNETESLKRENADLRTRLSELETRLTTG